MRAITIAIDAAQVVTIKLVDDSGKVQVAQLEGDAPEDGDDISEAETMLPYGFTANPPDGSEAIVIQVGGDAGNAVVLTMQHRDQRPTGLAKGEVALHMGADVKVHLKADGKVYLGSSAASDPVALSSKVDAEIDRIWDVLTSWTVAPQDGGAALQAAAIAASAGVLPTAADNVIAE